MADSTQPSVSIVVPFYNVEECVDYCMESLLAQTYDNFEIVCVDDGSTDGTWERLQRFAELGRIRLYRIANSGQSIARNFGLSKACGEYIAFVDGDDLVSPYYLESLTHLLGSVETRTLVIGQSIPVSLKDATRGSISWKRPELQISELSRDEAICSLLYNKITESPWCKLGPRSVYLENPFPAHRKYEDLAVITSVFNSCDQFFVHSDRIYGYVQRTGSTVRQHSSTLGRVNEYLLALRDFEENLPEDWSGSTALAYRQSLAFSRIHALIQNIDEKTTDILALDTWIQRFVRTNLPRILKDQHASMSQKIRFILLAYIPHAHDFAIKLVHSMS